MCVFLRCAYITVFIIFICDLSRQTGSLAELLNVLFHFYSSWLSFWVPEQHENELTVEKEMKHLEQRVTARSCVVLITLPFFFSARPH